jgi:hypothetical protein
MFWFCANFRKGFRFYLAIVSIFPNFNFVAVLVLQSGIVRILTSYFLRVVSGEFRLLWEFPCLRSPVIQFIVIAIAFVINSDSFAFWPRLVSLLKY